MPPPKIRKIYKAYLEFASLPRKKEGISQNFWLSQMCRVIILLFYETPKKCQDYRVIILSFYETSNKCQDFKTILGIFL